MLLLARTPTLRTASMAVFIVASLVIELAGSGRPHDTLEAARPHAPAPRPPSISDAALSPVEPISVLTFAESRVGTTISEVMARVNSPIARAFA
jgi:hypothetical protein